MQEIKSEIYADFENEIQKSTNTDYLLDLNVDIITAGACGEISEKETEDLLKKSSHKCKNGYV